MNEKIVKGGKYNYWTAIEPVIRNNSVDEMWLCECQCGRKRELSRYRLIRYRDGKEDYNGCGYCEKKLFENHPRLIIDGKKNPAYSVWLNMRERCLNPNCKAYKDYGGRGITVCEEWENNFLEFYNFVSKLDHFGESGRSIDRIDNNKGYFPGNVRWATSKEQANNKRQRKKRCEYEQRTNGSEEKSD